MPYRVGPKGQVVVAKEIRDRLGIGPGWVAIQRLTGDHVEMHFLPPDHNESLKGSLAPYVHRDVSHEEWDRVRDRAWRDAADDRERETDPSR
ncbi:MAG: AbrB/MazE/SpoVT family DNA-binding domain-containing protein [Chloroflexi bacterium]|nr:AbrB/MazE/SpoVT family DNA-binding domain-containing protein [Chloroflexota bacterium]